MNAQQLELWKCLFKDFISILGLVGQVGALQRDPYLSVFWSSPRYDLKLSMPMEDDNENKKRPWPDLELLFGEDPEYKTMVHDVLRLVVENLDAIVAYSKVLHGMIQVVSIA